MYKMAVIMRRPFFFHFDLFVSVAVVAVSLVVHLALVGIVLIERLVVVTLAARVGLNDAGRL